MKNKNYLNKFLRVRYIMFRFFSKEFLNNFIGLTSVNVIGMLMPIITMPYLSRVLGADGYGVVLLFSTLSVFMLVIIDYSTNITGVRDAAENIGNPERLNEIYAKYQRLRLILTLIYIPLSLLYCYLFFSGNNVWFYLELLIVSALGYYLSAPWFHQGTSTLPFFSVVSVSSRLVQLFLIFLVVKNHDSVDMAMRLNAYSFLLTGVGMYMYRRYRMRIAKSKPHTSIMKDFKEGFDAFIGEFSPNLYSNIPPLVIGALVSPLIFACYSVAIRITNISGSFQSIAAKSVYPLVVKGTSSLRLLLIINLFLSAIPFFSILFFGKEIIGVFLGKGYEQAYIYLMLCSPAIVLYSILCSFSYGYFLPKRLDAHFKKISLISSIIPAIIGYPLLHFYEAFGAIFMLLLARAFFAGLFVFYYVCLEKKQ